MALIYARHKLITPQSRFHAHLLISNILILTILIKFVNSAYVDQSVSSIITLHSKQGYQGDRIFVDLVGCQNLHSFNDKVASVSLKPKSDPCIRLHTKFGCQGHYLDLDKYDAMCGENLAHCGFNKATSSVSRCDYQLSGQYNSFNETNNNSFKTTRGDECQSPCSMSKNVHYFWCYTDLLSKSWDYCSPHDGVDYFGNICTSPCTHEGYRYSWCYCDKCKYVSRRKGWKDSWGYCSM